jgi:type III secretion system YscQ/HrcQ family protein
VARAIADRAVGGPGTDVAIGPTPLSLGEAGLVGYVVARALAHARSPFGSLLDAGKARDLVAAWKSERLVAISAELTLGDVRGLAMLLVPIAALESLSTPARAIDGAIPVRASVIVGDARLSLRDVRALAPGDVIVPDALTLDPRLADVGRARLVIGRSARTFDLELREGAWRVLSSAGSPAPRPPVRWKPRKDRPMSQPETDTLQSLSDVEVELSIELARLELPIAEVAALAPGVVVTTGRLVGERVAVRAGDRVIAWGELVDVEGEVGVRLTEVSARGDRD